jgi:hypothetical protein
MTIRIAEQVPAIVISVFVMLNSFLLSSSLLESASWSADERLKSYDRGETKNKKGRKPAQ